MPSEIVTAAAIAIGDELLSGRTRDRNIGHLASLLTSIGINLREVRIVPDEEDKIVKAVNSLRQQHDYVFTSGGIGPTHDDITADSISKAFDLPCIHDERAMALLEDMYRKRDKEFTPARQRMARMPKGASLIDNPVSTAPGFKIENVHVMAGVPSVFEAMLDNIIPTLKTGRKLISKSVNCSHGEGVIGGPLGDIQTQYPDVSIGSYPSFNSKDGDNGSFSTEIIARGLVEDDVDKALDDIKSLLQRLNDMA